MALTINQLLLKLNNLEKININECLTEAALKVEATAKELAPVDTGYLRNSITHVVDGNRAEIGTNAEYAPYQEYGTGLFAVNGDGRKDVPWRYQTPDGRWHSTSGNAPHPFLGPALDMNETEIRNIFNKKIKEALK